ncbi:hypothetical protein EBT16_15105 [bacterium]|nr:hypothetical protein [bacterium]
MDAIESIFRAAGFTYLREREGKDVITTTVQWDENGKGQVLVTPGYRGQSILLCCSYDFVPPLGCIGKVRRFFQDESLDMRGLSVEFYPRYGVQLTARYWVPSVDLPLKQIISLIDPYLTGLLFYSVTLFPRLARFLRGLSRTESLDDFHLPS